MHPEFVFHDEHRKHGSAVFTKDKVYVTVIDISNLILLCTGSKLHVSRSAAIFSHVKVAVNRCKRMYTFRRRDVAITKSFVIIYC